MINPEWVSFRRLRFRWRAAIYGVRIRLLQSSFELLRFVAIWLGLALTLSVAALTSNFPPRISPSAELLPWAIPAGVVLAASAWGAIRYLGSLSRIMDIAAWSEEGAARLQKDMEIGMRNEHAYQQLIALYEPIAREAGTKLNGRQLAPVAMGPDRCPNRYAAIALQVGEERLESILTGLKEVDHRPLRKLADGRQRLIRAWRVANESASQLEDERGNNYCLESLSVEGGRLSIGAKVATYGEIVRSCDAMIEEFALFAYLTGPIGRRSRVARRPERKTLRMSPATTLRSLPWRNRVHTQHRARPRDFRRRRDGGKGRSPRAAHLFTNPSDRAAGIGVAVVTMTQEGDSLKAFLGLRSSKVGTYPVTNHVIPAGMCNTYGTDFEALKLKRPPGWYLETAMKCEFLEEWTNAKEFETHRRHDWKERVEAAWNGRIGEQRASAPTLTGIAFDLLNLRPEICATTVVSVPEAELNWEFDKIGFSGSLAEMSSVNPTEIVQGGAAALMLAQQALSRRPNLEPMPEGRQEPDETGWIPAAEYERIQQLVPILCVDLLPLRNDGAIGLIRRETPDGEGWCLVGGAVRRNEELREALERHLRSTLGDQFHADLTAAVPLATIQYFTERRPRHLHDPRKHAVAITYAATCDGPHTPRDEARDFRWFGREELDSVEYGFGQGEVVRKILDRLAG